MYVQYYYRVVARRRTRKSQDCGGCTCDCVSCQIGFHDDVVHIIIIIIVCPRA